MSTPHDTPRPPQLTLVSHALCPYVQRAAIALAEKGVPFERITIDLSNKPAWFKALSPLGKVPLLALPGGAVLFESAAICEYLEDTEPQPLHPLDPVQRARHRAWMEFGSNVLNLIAGFYNAVDAAALQAKSDQLHERFATLERELESRSGPWFAGADFSLVDAVFAPVFRYFDSFEAIVEFGFFDALPRVGEWREALARRPSVRDAVVPDYPQRLALFLRARGSELARRMAARDLTPA